MITKSHLQSLLQCARKLWLEHHKPNLIGDDDPTVYRRTTDGQIVGERAREQLGAELIWPPTAENEVIAAERAKTLLARTPQKPAVEVPMVSDGLYARADALVPEDSGYVLRETKAKTFPLKGDKVTPGAPEDHHLEDAAIQIWAMEGFGFVPVRVELNLLNNQWRYPGGGDYSGLFRQLDVTVQAQDRKSEVVGWLKQARSVLEATMPEVTTGKQCSDPYDCPFLDFCKEHDPKGPEHPIELLPDKLVSPLPRNYARRRGIRQFWIQNQQNLRVSKLLCTVAFNWRIARERPYLKMVVM